MIEYVQTPTSYKNRSQSCWCLFPTHWCVLSTWLRTTCLSTNSILEPEAASALPFSRSVTCVWIRICFSKLLDRFMVVFLSGSDKPNNHSIQAFREEERKRLKNQEDVAKLRDDFNRMVRAGVRSFTTDTRISNILYRVPSEQNKHGGRYVTIVLNKRKKYKSKSALSLAQTTQESYCTLFHSQVGRTDSPAQKSPAESLAAEVTPKTEPNSEAGSDSSANNEPVLQGVVQGHSGVLFFTQERKTTPPALRRPASVPGVLRYVDKGACVISR